ncbi:hypothetical protein PRIPAC_75804 [Pristionchus pacificus]|uniref:Ion channel n=1 Tax=Pristionchus pacificus TaxID=54126 RepID=A0A2A6C5E4_PRIPA|nr:hypothetical protein PRIPAC_75804 [Pristionchus pacificus]|eukprot:PDM73384.1 ion channel [Pristionchus pacificus]
MRLALLLLFCQIHFAGGLQAPMEQAIDDGGGGGGGGVGGVKELPYDPGLGYVDPNPNAQPDAGGVGGGDPPTDPPPTDPPPTEAPTTEPPTEEAPTAAPPTDTPNPGGGEPATDAPTAAPTDPPGGEPATTEAPTQAPPATTQATVPTTTTTEKPTTTTEDRGRCGQYTADDGKVYADRCKTKDTKATCAMDTSQPYCTCSAGWTDTYCAVNMQAFGNLGGNSSEGLVDVINVGKTSPARLIASLPALLSFLTDEQRVQMSYDVEEMIVDASFEELPLNIRESFTLFNDPSLGNCFTFNHFNASLQYQSRGAGPRYGVFTFIHPIGQNIYLESVKHTVQPGNADQIAMKKSSFKRLRGLFTHCAAGPSSAQSFYFPGDYSVDGCLRSCYQDSVYRSCGCMDPSYARKPGVAACNFEKLACIEEMSAKRGDPYHWPECRCDVPCDEIEYRYETSQAMHLQTLSSNTSRTSEIVIYLVTLYVYSQVEQWTFPFSRVLGLTGGFAGVLLGICVVFVIELILLVVRVALIGITNTDPLRMKKDSREKMR